MAVLEMGQVFLARPVTLIIFGRRSQLRTEAPLKLVHQTSLSISITESTLYTIRLYPGVALRHSTFN